MKRSPPNRPDTASDGMAMVLVLWLLGMIAALAAVAARVASAQDSGAALALERVHAQFALTAAIDAAAWQIVSRKVQSGGGMASVKVGGSVANVSYESEMSRIDINMVSQPLLEGLFSSVGISPAGAGRLAAAVIDWRDADDETTPGGAEKLAYGPGKGPRNGPFADPAEIVDVLGVTPAIAAMVQPLITVASGSDKIDPGIAQPGVMLALPGVTPLKLASYLDALRLGRPQAEAEALLGDVGSYVAESNSLAWHLDIDVSTGDGMSSRYQASLMVSPSKDAPYQVLRLSEAAAPPPPAPSGPSPGKGVRS